MCCMILLGKQTAISSKPKTTTLTSSQPSWVRRFSEQEVALIYSLLSIAGFQLRSDDPAAMKVEHDRVTTL